MNNASRWFKLLNLIAILIAMTSCNTDELCYHHPHESDLTILFDWTDSPEANPEEMRVLFYPFDDVKGTAKDMPPTGSRYYDIIVGEYRLISHSHDSEVIRYSHDAFYEDYIAYTADADILSPMRSGYSGSSGLRTADDEPVRHAPDQFWGATMEYFKVGKCDTIILKPQPLYCHYTYEFRNVGGSIKHIKNMSAAISGMAHAVNLTTGELTTETSTLPLEAHIGEDGNSVVGSFYTFGHHEAVEKPHRMSLYVEMDDGKKYKYVDGDALDVTSQIHNAPNPRRVHIIVDGLHLPTAIENGNGFNVGLEDWDNENVDIII